MTTPTPTTEPTTPPPVGPRLRAARTVVQTVLAVLVAVPSAVAVLPLSAGSTVWVVGITGALVIVISAGHNAIDAHAQKGR